MFSENMVRLKWKTPPPPTPFWDWIISQAAVQKSDLAYSNFSESHQSLTSIKDFCLLKIHLKIIKYKEQTPVVLQHVLTHVHRDVCVFTHVCTAVCIYDIIGNGVGFRVKLTKTNKEIKKLEK